MIVVERILGDEDVDGIGVAFNVPFVVWKDKTPVLVVVK